MPLSLLLQQACVAGLFLSVVYYIYFQLTTGAQRRKLIQENGCLPPYRYPTKDPFFGLDEFKNTIAAANDKRFLSFVASRFARIGRKTFEIPVLNRNLIITIEPENLKTIQALKFKDFGLGYQRKQYFVPFLGHGIFTTDGAQWQHSRDMLRPNFVRSQVGNIESFETHVSHLLQAIPRNGSTIDLQELFFRLTIDSATEFLFGESTSCLAPGISTVSAAKFAVCFNRGQVAIARNLRFSIFSFFLDQRQSRADTAFVHEFVDGFVKNGLARRNEILSEKPEDGQRYVFLRELVRQTTDAKTIRDELLNILLAGRDTTASLLSNVWWQISNRPDIYSKLREEVATIQGTPTFETLKDLKYLRAVLNESLRLHPVVPANSREAVRDTVLPRGGGPDGTSPILVKKGQLVAFNVYTMHRLKEFYGPDADEFKPERWLGEKGLRPGWEYLPFNGGPRICLGQQFALTEASYCTVRMLQTFAKCESRDPEPWTEFLALTCVGAGGCKVSLTPA